MRRITAILMAVCISISLCACGGKQPTAILFSQKTIELEIAGTYQQKYTLVPEDADTTGLNWQSANTEIATVDSEGNIIGIAPGTTTIVCSTPKGVMETCEVTVKSPSAYEQLGDDEKRLYNFLIDLILPNFNDPSSARICDIYDTKKDEDHTNGFMVFIDMKSNNKLGGITHTYMLSHYRRDKNDWVYQFSKNNMLVEHYVKSTKFDYSKINAALEEYWLEQNVN